MKNTTARSFLRPAFLLTGLMLNQVGKGEEIPRPELACQIVDDSGRLITYADQTPQQRFQVARCMNAFDRYRNQQSSMENNQLQYLETVKRARQAADSMSWWGHRAVESPSLSPSILQPLP